MDSRGSMAHFGIMFISSVCVAMGVYATLTKPFSHQNSDEIITSEDLCFHIVAISTIREK